MKEELVLRNRNFCDGCKYLLDTNTLGGIKKCEIYRNNRTPEENAFIASKGSGYFPRPEHCIEDYG